MLQKEQNQNGFKEKFAAVLIFIGILVVFAVVKNISPAVNSSDSQFNKAGFTFPSSIFVGNKELSGIEIDTTKSAHNRRSFSYFQKEDGKLKRYRVRMEEGKLTGLTIDGEKVPQEKLDSYRKDVEEAYSKLDDENIFFTHDMFSRGGWFADSMKNYTHEISNAFNSKEFREQMAEMRKEIAASTAQLKKELNSEKFQKEMKELQKEMKENASKWQKQFNSEEGKKIKEDIKKEMEKMKKELKESKHEDGDFFDSEQFARQMEKLGEEIANNVEKIDFESLVNMGSLKNLEHLKSLDHMNNAVAMKGFEKGMTKFNAKMKNFSEKMKVFGEKMKVFGKFMKEVKDLLVDEKIIDKDEDDVNINIKKDGVYVDGKKQSDALFEKVKKIYRKYYDKEFNGDFDFSI